MGWSTSVSAFGGKTGFFFAPVVFAVNWAGIALSLTLFLRSLLE